MDEYAKKTSICQLVGTEAFTAAAKSFNITAEISLIEVRADIRGLENPSTMEKPFWKHMVYTCNSPYGTREKNGWEDNDPYDRPQMWTFSRLGYSRTDLPDGRRVFVAGEYDDSYDPDFFIYNDVIVIDPRITPFGPASVTIYGYPLDVFPPTDHHTSTLYTEPASEKQYIAIIGGQGDGRLEGPHKDSTTLYRLGLQDFRIEKMNLDQAGAPAKPLIYHRAQLLETEEVKSLFPDRQGSVIVKLTPSTFNSYYGLTEAEDAPQSGSQSDFDGEEMERIFATLIGNQDIGRNVDEVSQTAVDEDIEEVALETSRNTAVDGVAGNPKEEVLESPAASNSTNDEPEEPEEPFVEEIYYLDLTTLQWIRP